MRPAWNLTILELPDPGWIAFTLACTLGLGVIF